jgi:hypothetical protein
VTNVLLPGRQRGSVRSSASRPWGVYCWSSAHSHRRVDAPAARRRWRAWRRSAAAAASSACRQHSTTRANMRRRARSHTACKVRPPRRAANQRGGGVGAVDVGAVDLQGTPTPPFSESEGWRCGSCGPARRRCGTRRGATHAARARRGRSPLRVAVSGQNGPFLYCEEAHVNCELRPISGLVVCGY